MSNAIGFAALKTTEIDGKRRLNVVLAESSSELSASQSSSFKLGKTHNLTLRKINDIYNALAVVCDTDATPFDGTSVIRTVRHEIRQSGDSYCLVVNKTENDATPSRAIVLYGSHLAINDNDDLILAPVVISIEEDGFVRIGDRNLRAVRNGSNWYLVVHY